MIDAELFPEPYHDIPLSKRSDSFCDSCGRPGASKWERIDNDEQAHTWHWACLRRLGRL